MSPLGPMDLKNVTLPGAWDAAELRRLQLRDGTTYEGLIRDIDDGLSLANSKLKQGYLAQLFSTTTDATLEYRTGVSNGYQDATEYGQPDAQRAETTGHMLPLWLKDRKLGWTYLWLMEARRKAIDADIASLVDDTMNAFQQAVLTRFFRMEEETGRRLGLGATGVSVPFCDGGGGTVPFTPIAVPDRGGAFLATHNHYLRLTGFTQANVESAVLHLWEHGINGPYEMIVSLADIAAWTTIANVTGYVPKADALIQYGDQQSLAKVGEEYVGGIKTQYGFCRLVALGRIPAHYWGVTKSYGSLDDRNPLKVRYDEVFGFGAKLVSSQVGTYPIQGAVGMMKAGVGVGESRTGAVLVLEAAGGNYITPVIS